MLPLLYITVSFFTELQYHNADTFLVSFSLAGHLVAINNQAFWCVIHLCWYCTKDFATCSIFIHWTKLLYLDGKLLLLWVKCEGHVKFSRQCSQYILNPTILNLNKCNSSGKVCLQLFGATHVFMDIEYCAEQVCVSESITEIFPADFSGLAF